MGEVTQTTFNAQIREGRALKGAKKTLWKAIEGIREKKGP